MSAAWLTPEVCSKIEKLNQDIHELENVAYPDVNRLDAIRIALKCSDIVFCIRKHIGYDHGKLTSKAKCPRCCTLYKTDWRIK